MADIKTKYPAASSVALALTAASLASDSTLLTGRASTAVDNTTNLDLDHLLSGVITTGTSPTANTIIELWAYASRKSTAGVPVYPNGITGTDAPKTISSFNVKNAALRLIAGINVDATSNQAYDFAQVSIANLFGGMPKFWGVFIVHNTGPALNSTAANIDLQYERVQAQTV